MNINTDLTYPVGSHYVSENSTNPSSKLGGTWELVRRTYGGELLAYGVAKNTTTGSTVFNSNQYYSMSDLEISEDLKDDYSGQNVLVFEWGAWHIYTQGIVGMVKSTSIITGLSQGNKAFWWSGNANPLPTGVSMSPSTRCPLVGGITSGNYGGCLMVHYYKITPGTTGNFYVNPKWCPYNGDFIPGGGGVGLCVEVEVYAATGVHYIWKRTA